MYGASILQQKGRIHKIIDKATSLINAFETESNKYTIKYKWIYNVE